jgi:hypothetical protein
MKNATILVLALTMALAGGACQEEDRRAAVAPIQSSSVPDSPTLTLSADQLIFLDWNGKTASRTRVLRKRVAGDLAVEFDIHFSSNQPGNRSIDYVSGGAGGRGSLIGFDISSFDAFALKFTLVSIGGVAGSDATQELAVGALIGPTAAGKLSVFTPVTLGGASGRTTAVASTLVDGDKVQQIGFHAQMVNPERWSASGVKVTLRVAPVEGATVRPWP